MAQLASTRSGRPTQAAPLSELLYGSIFWIYVLFLTACLFEIRVISQYLLLFLLIPLTLIQQAYDWRINDRVRSSHFPVNFSIIFCASALYLVSLLFSGIIIRDLGFSIQIVLFLLLTGILVSSWEDFLRSFFTVMGVVAALHAVSEIASWLSRTSTLPIIDAYLSGFRLGRPRAATTLAAMYGMFLVACLATLSRGVTSVWHRLILTASGLILLFAVLLTQTRSGYLAVLGGITAVLIRSSRMMRFAAMAMPILGVMLIISIPTLRDTLWLRGDSYRFETWSHYLQLAEEEPVRGHGSADVSFKANDGYHVKHPHNLVLSSLVRGGVLGAVAMITMLLGGLYYAARYAKLTGNAVALGIMVTLLLFGLFDQDIRPKRFFHWQILVFWLPIGICIGTELFVRARSAHLLRKGAGE